MNFRQWLEEEKKDLSHRLVSYPRRRYLITVFVTFFFLWSFFETWSLLSRRTAVNFDIFVVERINQVRTPFFDTLFSTITYFGSLNFILILSILLSIFLIRARRKRATFIFSVSLFLNIVFLFFFKVFFGRERPNGCPGTSLDCFSFPSGHVALSFYFYGLLGYLFHRFFFKSKIAFFLLMILPLSFVSLIALSRVYLGVHYLSDLMGGFLLGGMFLFGSAILIDLLYR